MIKRNGYTIIEITIIVIALSIFLGIFVNANFKRESNEIKKVVSDIQDYTVSIGEFKRKYGFLPGDIKKTQIFSLSETNTDGNENNIIEDLNQQVGISNQNLRLDGEIGNFWLHLYKSDFTPGNNNIYPFLEYFNSGILVFSKNNQNYFHIGIAGTNKDNEIELINILTPNQAYQIDKKMDDGLPYSGRILVYGGKYLNAFDKNNVDRKCATANEYLTIYEEQLCQLIIELNI